MNHNLINIIYFRNLSDILIESFPDAISNLKNLKYLYSLLKFL